MRRGLLLKICAAAVVLYLALSVVRGAEYLLLTACAVLIHEAGHVAAAKALRVPFVRVRGSLVGFSLKFDFSAVSYFKEFSVCAAGAAANVAACAVSFLLTDGRGAHFVFFIFSNLSLAVFNLLPISPLDGAGMLSSLLSLIVSARSAERIVSFVSAAFSLAFFIFCTYVQMKIGVNFSLLFISVYLIYNTAKNAGIIQKAP